VDLARETVTFSVVEPAGGSESNMWFKVAADRTVPRGAIRALFDGAGLKVSRVMLVKWGPIALPRDLPRGRSRPLAGPDLEALYGLAGRGTDEPPKKKSVRATKRPPPDRRRKPTTAARRTGNR
jgi:23S rRNA pseudouridine2605 synthase